MPLNVSILNIYRYGITKISGRRPLMLKVPALKDILETIRIFQEAEREGRSINNIYL